MDTTNTQIREVPEGFVSTEDVIAAFREVGEVQLWCGTERRYLEENTDIRFGRQTWNSSTCDYEPIDFDAWTVTEGTPDIISKAQLVKTLRAGMEGHPYEARKGVNVLAERLGLDFQTFNDTFEVTIRVDSNKLLDSDDELNLDDDSIEDTDRFARAMRSIVNSTFYDRDGFSSLQNNDAIESGMLTVKRIPDPARSKAR